MPWSRFRTKGFHPDHVRKHCCRRSNLCGRGLLPSGFGLPRPVPALGLFAAVPTCEPGFRLSCAGVLGARASVLASTSRSGSPTSLRSGRRARSALLLWSARFGVFRRGSFGPDLTRLSACVVQPTPVCFGFARCGLGPFRSPLTRSDLGQLRFGPSRAWPIPVRAHRGWGPRPGAGRGSGLTGVGACGSGAGRGSGLTGRGPAAPGLVASLGSGVVSARSRRGWGRFGRGWRGRGTASRDVVGSGGVGVRVGVWRAARRVLRRVGGGW
ncbi:hypothetical protein BKA14_000386 [Actinoplanes abujensis]|uniref:Uncharacterized protein n=1 Tax=Paractinoplanes abujensis TaxID=882441 RepID=A0A7W7CKK8_9ACTN|nr:hypothetical protein [Actinoplanes abujensis]